MRVPSASEIVLLARVLSRAEPDHRPARALSILAEVDVADAHIRKTGRAHPDFGDGSLLSRCSLLCPPAEPLCNDRDFLASLALAARVMLVHSER
jgi:hypothetical protein